MRTMLMLLLCCCWLTAAHATEWDLKKEEEGIKVYTGSVSNTNIKAVRVELLINASMSQLAGLLVDIKAHDRWVYNARNTYLIKQIAPGNLIYYSEVSLPWPLNNRDVVAELSITQNPVTRVMSVAVNSVTKYMPDKKNLVRVPFLKINWTATPVSDHQVSIEYEAQVDPGGTLPAWLINSFSTKGTMETFKNFRKLLANDGDQHPAPDFIKN